MRRKTGAALAAALAFGLGSAALTNAVQADNFWDMMDPEWWFGDDDWEYRVYGPGRYYAGGAYGWGGHPGYYGYPYAAAPRPKSSQQEVPAPKLPE